MNRLALAGLCFLLAFPAGAFTDLAINSTSTAQQSATTGVSSHTWSFNNVGGTLLVCNVNFGAVGTNDNWSTVTYGGTAMTNAVKRFQNPVSGNPAGPSGSGSSQWYLLNPKTGANNVIITMTGTVASGGVITSGCISFTGNHPTSPIGVTNTSDSNDGAVNSGSIGLSGTASGSIVLGSFGAGNNLSVPTGGTSDWLLNVNTLSASGNFGGQHTTSTGALVTFGWTIAGDQYAATILEVKANTANRLILRSSTTSPCADGNVLFTMDQTTASGVQHTLTPVAFSTDQKFYYTTTLHPNSNNWNGSYTIRYRVITANSGASIFSASVYRYNSSCVFQESASGGFTLDATTAGTKSATGTVTFAGPVSCNDLLVVSMDLNDFGGLGETVTYEVNVDPTSTLEIPFAEGSGCNVAAPPAPGSSVRGTIRIRLRPSGKR